MYESERARECITVAPFKPNQTNLLFVYKLYSILGLASYLESSFLEKKEKEKVLLRGNEYTYMGTGQDTGG